MPTPEQAQRILEQAASLRSNERDAFLDEACAGDEALRREVGSLLAFYDTSPDLLDRLAQSVIPDVERLAGREKQRIGRFEVQDELGRGGMGVVYRATDTRLGRTVALKFLPAHLSRSAEARARFEQEARAASRLNHPHVCSVHELGVTDDGDWYIVMPYYEGGTLEDRLREGPMPLEEAVAIIRQVASGLAKAHEAGIVHRDIKPSNIMIEDGRAVIMDFGVAKLAESENLTETEAVLGTMAFMSPEQLRGEALDARSDLWSLGVVFYWMLAGERPFVADYPQAYVYTILNEDPQPLDVDPPEIGQVVMRLLEKDRNARFGSATALIDALPAAGSGTGITTTAGAIERNVRPRTRQVLMAVAALSVLVAAIWTFRALNSMDESDPAIRKLVVFPLTPGPGTDEENVEYATQEIVDQLGRLERIVVAPLPLVSGPVESGAAPESIARNLQADAYLEGMATTTGDELELEAILSDVRTGELLWRQQYIGPVTELGLYHDIARGVVEASSLVLSEQERDRLETDRKVDPEAIKTYVRARRLRGFGGEQDRAADLLNEAVALDSSFAEAWAELGLTYLRLSLGRDPLRYWPLARHAAEKALAVDSSSGLAWHVLGAYEMFWEWDWSASEHAREQAIAFAPNNSTIRLGLASLYTVLGREDEVHREIIRVTTSPWPLHKDSRLIIEMLYALLGDGEATVRHATETLSQHPDAIESQMLRAVGYALQGDSAAAAEDLAAVMPEHGAVRDSKLSMFHTSWGAVAYAMIGREETTRRYLEELEREIEGQYMCTYEMALAWAHLGDLDRAFHWIDKGLETRANCLPFAKVDTRTKPLWPDPRYAALLDSLGL